jgi:cytochrome P450
LQKITAFDKIVYDHGEIAIRNMRKNAANAQNLFGQMVAQADAEDDKARLTDESVRDEAGNLIVAGSDTTAVTLTYLVWAVLKHPAVQAALEEEVAGLSDGLELDELERAPWLNAVIEETLRLYGAAPGGLPRSVPDGGVTFCGHFLPSGTEVTTQAYTIHRDGKIWPNPLL